MVLSMEWRNSSAAIIVCVQPQHFLLAYAVFFIIRINFTAKLVKISRDVSCQDVVYDVGNTSQPCGVVTCRLGTKTAYTYTTAVNSLIKCDRAGWRTWYSDCLRAGRSGDRIPWGEIFRICPDGPWGPLSLLYNGSKGSFPGVKRPGRDADPSPPSSAEVKNRIELNLYSP